MTNIVTILGRDTSSNVQKVTWLLEELGQDYSREDYGGSFGRTAGESYLRLNPNRTVPTLIDGDFVLWESNSICRYLANRFGPTPLYPEDFARRADCERWMDWQLGTLTPVMAPLYIGTVRTPPGQRDEAHMDALRQQACALFALLDGILVRDGTSYLCGDEMTLADISLGAWLYRWHELGCHEEHTKALTAWFGRLAGREPYRRLVMTGLN